MMRKILLPTIFALLAYGFWLSPDFKEIASGVAIFLFGMLSLEEGFKAFTGGVLENWLRRSTKQSFQEPLLWLFLNKRNAIQLAGFCHRHIFSVSGLDFIVGRYRHYLWCQSWYPPLVHGWWLGFGLKVNISAYAMPMIVFGVILLFQKSKELRGIGYVLTGPRVSVPRVFIT